MGIGLALGVVVAGVFEFMDDRLYSAKEIRKLLPAEIIGEIPPIVNVADSQRTRRTLWLGWMTAIFVLGIILVGTAFTYLRG